MQGKYLPKHTKHPSLMILVHCSVEFNFQYGPSPNF